MAENVVKIEFQADDTSTTAAFSKLNAEVNTLGSGGLSKAQSAMAGFSKETQIADSTVISFGKSSTTFGKLSAEMQQSILGASGSARQFAQGAKEASAATKEVGEAASSSGGFMNQFVGRLIGVGAAFEVLRLAAEGVKYVIGASMDLETADVRFKSMAGNTAAATKAFAGMDDVAKSTLISVADLSKAGTTLLEAGVPMNKIDDDLKVMGQQADITGESLQTMADIQLRLSRGEVSARDLTAITRATGDESGMLQAQFRDISVTIPAAAKAMEQLQRATERTRHDTDQIAVRLEQDNDLLETQAMHDRNLADSRSRQDQDRSQSRAQEDRDIRERRRTEDTGAVGGFTPDKGPAQVETYNKFGKGGAVIEGSFERGQREEANRIGIAREERAKEDRELQVKRAREDREQQEDRSRADRDQLAERSRAARNLAAGRDRTDSGTQAQRDNEDERQALQMRKESEKAQLVEDARNELTGASDTPVWDAAQRQNNLQKWRGTTEGQARAAGFGIHEDASHAGDAVRSEYDLEARDAGTVRLPWDKAPTQADASWTKNLMNLAPGKAQHLPMSEESGKLLIKNTGDASDRLDALLELFKTS